MAETIGLLIVGSIAPGAITGIGFGSALSGATFLGVNLATAVGTAAIIGVSIGLQYALRPDVPRPESGSQAIKQAIPPRIRGYGLNRLSGYYMLFETDGQESARSYDVIAFHSGRIGKINGIFLHDDPVTTVTDISLGGTAAVAAGYDDGRYAGHVVLTTTLGHASQAAAAYPLPFWTSAHKGNGIAWLGMICAETADPQEFTKIYPRNKPEPSVVAECSLVWDPRDPTQFEGDPTTWKVSFNPVIQLIDYLTCQDGGLGLSRAEILPDARLAEWMVEANLCDPIPHGEFKPRYECHGWYQFDNEPEKVIGGILSTCDGWMAEAGDGTLALTIGVYREPEDSPLTGRHIRGFALNYGTADEEMVNQLDISYTEPSRKYVSVQASPLRDEVSIALTGRVRSQPIDLKWVQSELQALRLADRALKRLNPRMSGSFTTTLYGLKYLGKRWVPIQYPFVSGLQDCVVEITNAEVDLLAGRISWDFIRVAPDEVQPYEPPSDDDVPPVLPPGNVIDELDFRLPGNSQYIPLLEDI